VSHPIEPIRVLHVTDVETSNYYLNNLVDFSRELPVQYCVVTLGTDRGFLRDLRQRGVTTRALEYGSRRAYPLAALQLAKLIREWKIEIVHTHLFGPSLVGLMVAKSMGRKTVMTRHHSDAVFRIKGKLKHKSYLALEKLSNRLADHIIAPSKMVEEVLREREGVPAAKLSLIPYGQNFQRFETIGSAQIEKVAAELNMRGTLAIVCVCRLFREKGHRYLFEALSKLKSEGRDFHLFLAGVGNDQPQIEQQCASAGLAENTSFLGWRDDVLSIVAAADLFIHPSLHEALPSAVIEAMLLERPVIATNVSGVRDIVDKYGKIVPPADAASLADALRWTMDNLEAAREASRLGRQRILQEMDPAKVANSYASIYVGLCRNPGANTV
jgi:L-malate glycosyltransferase